MRAKTLAAPLRKKKGYDEIINSPTATNFNASSKEKSPRYMNDKEKPQPFFEKKQIKLDRIGKSTKRKSALSLAKKSPRTYTAAEQMPASITTISSFRRNTVEGKQFENS